MCASSLSHSVRATRSALALASLAAPGSAEPLGGESTACRNRAHRPAGGCRGSADPPDVEEVVGRPGVSTGLDRLVLGLAGPRWGKSDETGIAVGRDIVIVMDLSRSMQAPDMADASAPTRWQAAKAGAIDLLGGIAVRGGHRVAIVAFAAHPKVICPLTTDYDHVRAVLNDLDGIYPPPEIRPGAMEVTSGTRIGAALRVAVKTHDQRFPGCQDVVLISDGDDPAEDREWVRGSDEARKARIPVHTVGVGNPFEDYILAFGDELAPTRLKEEPLNGSPPKREVVTSPPAESGRSSGNSSARTWNHCRERAVAMRRYPSRRNATLGFSLPCWGSC